MDVPPSHATERKRWPLVRVLGSTAMGAAFCAVVSAAVFLPVLGARFVNWDDPWLVSENPRLTGLTWSAVRDVLLNTSRSSPGYTPLMGLRFNLVRQLGGLDPRPFHLANLLIHAIDAALLFWLLRALLRTARHAPDSAPGDLRDVRDNLAATAAALLWALHPLRVEVVAWVSGGAHEQALLFMLLSMLAHVEAARAGGRRRMWLEALSALAYLAAGLSQPAALGLVGPVLAFDWWRARTDPLAGKRRLPSVLRGAAPHLVVGAVLLAVNAALQLHSPVTVHRPVSLAEFGLVPRLAQALYLLAYYLWRPFFPIGLSPVYTDLVAFDPWSLPFVGSGLAVLALAAAAWSVRRRWPGVTALAASYFFLLLPVLGWTDHPYYPNDRYSTAAALVGSVALAFACAATQPDRRGIAAALAAGLLGAGLVPLTIRQCAVWKSSEALFRHTLVTLGDHPPPGGFDWRVGIRWRLGLELEAQRRFSEAADQYVRVLRIDARHPVAGRGLMRVCEEGGRRSRQDAIACYREALRASPEVAADR